MCTSLTARPEDPKFDLYKAVNNLIVEGSGHKTISSEGLPM